MDPLILGATGVVFVGTAAAAGAAYMVLAPERTARDRLREVTQQSQKGGEVGILERGAMKTVTSKVAELAKPTGDEGNLLKRRLMQAGFRARNAVELYSASRALLALVVPAVVLVPLFLLKWELTTLLIAAIISVAIGYYIPAIVVSQRVSSRQAEIMRFFPDALDLLVSSVEAGLGLDAAFRRVADELEGPAPTLASELKQVNHEVTAGVSRIEALRHLDQRTGIDEVRQLVNVLAQAEKFGTSVARALRVHSDLVRQKRMLAAEEKAAQLSPKLTVVMILFIMPSLFAVILGPAMVQIYRNFITG